jgi:hypothetical protein
MRAGPTPNSYQVCPDCIPLAFRLRDAASGDGVVSVRFTVEGLACLEPTIVPISHAVAWNLIIYLRERCRIPFRGGAGQFPRSSGPQDPRGGKICGGEELYSPFRDRPPGKG